MDEVELLIIFRVRKPGAVSVNWPGVGGGGGSPQVPENMYGRVGLIFSVVPLHGWGSR